MSAPKESPKTLDRVYCMKKAALLLEAADSTYNTDIITADVLHALGYLKLAEMLAHHTPGFNDADGYRVLNLKDEES